ncbi:MAG: hypothetical protein ABIG96_04165 [Candidatus Micrarchaeota archaeon]
MENISKWISGKGALFIAIFSFAVLIADQIKFSAVWGAASQYFTAFQFIGPIAGGILGPVVGVISVLFAELISFIYLGKAFDAINILRLTPMLFAAYYFATFGSKRGLKGNYALLAPVAAMLLFVIHPVGGEAWYFSLFWLIPVVAALFFKDNLLARSLGATFAAHSIGSVVWLYSFPTTAGFWAALMPIVVYERAAFAVGIALSFVLFNAVLARLESKFGSGFLRIDRRYSLFGKAQPVKSRK